MSLLEASLGQLAKASTEYKKGQRGLHNPKGKSCGNYKEGFLKNTKKAEL